MNIKNLNIIIAQLRVAESMGGIPAKAMAHIQSAIERLERKVAKLQG